MASVEVSQIIINYPLILFLAFVLALAPGSLEGFLMRLGAILAGLRLR
jgi:hypothetical protein